MQRHLQCAEQQASPSNLTKCCACHVKSVSSWVLVSYETSFTMRRATDLILQHHQVTKCCACHAKWLASSILVTYETSFTMRGETCITFQPHQMLPLPRKMMRIIDLRHIWNVIYNARSNRHHPPTSPNTAPATQNCTPKSKKNLPKTAEASIPMRGRFEHDPTMIRTWSEHDPTMNSSSRTRPFAEVTFRASETHFVLKITTFRAPAIYSNFTEYCACHEKWIDCRDICNVIYNARSNRHHPPTSPNAAPAT